jgi:hypothetical protein
MEVGLNLSDERLCLPFVSVKAFRSWNLGDRVRLVLLEYVDLDL